jgi:hypothetical protein
LIRIENSYSAGTINGGEATGGIIGDNVAMDSAQEQIELVNVFASADVNGNVPADSGSIVGLHQVSDHQVSASGVYYDQIVVGLSNCAGNVELSSGCTAVNVGNSQPNYFKNNSTNAPLNSWDFSTIWSTRSNDLPWLGAVDFDESPGDSDNIPPAEEQAAPNSGDGNDDGTSDDEQDFVSSFVNDVASNYATLQVSNACVINTVNTSAESNNSVLDNGYSYPVGLMSFTVDCGPPGSVLTVNQYYYGLTNDNYVLRKYNPNTSTYEEVSGATINQVTIAGQSVLSVSYTVTDGGPLDSDGTANGVIIDPAGPAVLAASSGGAGSPNTGLKRHSTPMILWIVGLVGVTLGVSFRLRISSHERRQKR